MERKAGFPWWLIFIFTCFLSWLSVFIAGIIVEKRQWIIAGLIYAVPMFLIFTVSDSDEMKLEKERVLSLLEKNSGMSPSDSAKYAQVTELYRQLQQAVDKDKKQELKKTIERTIEKANSGLTSPWEEIVMGLWVVSALAAFAHALAIRKKYWELYYRQKFYHRKNASRKSAVKHPALLEASALKKRIRQKIQNSDYLDSSIVSDVNELLETFTAQIQKLVSDKEGLSRMLYKGQISRTESAIQVLRKKMSKEENSALKREYEDTIRTKEKLLESYKSLSVHKKTTDLRLEKAIASLKQIEYDINRLEDAKDRTKQDKFFNDFRKKTQDLSVFADELHREMKNSPL